MRFWLEKPCSELSREFLLDEHRSLHAYINGMKKNPDKWVTHSILGPMSPDIMVMRHDEEVQEMTNRGYKHGTPITEETIEEIKMHRKRLGLDQDGKYVKNNYVIVHEHLKELQEEYRRKHNG